MSEILALTNERACLRILADTFFLYLTISESLLAVTDCLILVSGSCAAAKQGTSASVIIDNFVFIVLSIVD